MKNTLKTMLALMLGIMMVFAMTACGGGSSEESGDAESAEGETLKVVTEATFAPFESTDEEGNIIGFDVDMMNAIAESQGLTIEWVNMEFDSLIPALQSNQGDIICAGMNKLAGDRAEKADFGDTYFESDLMLLVKATFCSMSSCISSMS